MDSRDIKLLYVEDEESVIEVMKDLLQACVKEFHIARDGEEAYELYSKHKPDVMLVDINIPKLNGLDLVEKIRKKDHNVKVILLTAYSDKKLLLRATELKLTKYLIKPLGLKEFIEALEMAADEIENLNIEYKKLVYLDDDFIWDMDSKVLSKNSNAIKLTPKETNILDVLLKKQNSAVSYDDIIYSVWEDSDTYSLDTLKTTVKSLRRKLPKDTIKNIYGIGYKIEI